MTSRPPTGVGSVTNLRVEADAAIGAASLRPLLDILRTANVVWQLQIIVRCK